MRDVPCIDFTDWTRIDLLSKKRDCPPSSPEFYKSMSKTIALYKLLSSEKAISDEDFLYQIGEEMRVLWEYDCRPAIDKKWWYKEEKVCWKKFKGLARLIGKKIYEKIISQERGYYLLCRVRWDCDPRQGVKEDIDWILQNFNNTETLPQQK